jgi:uncharacterized protein YjbI with pentapeptide repeats
MGTQFSECRALLLQLKFKHCLLRMAAFYGLKLKNTVFESCDLQEADFADADLTAAVFNACDLLMATFEGTNLEKADLRTAVNYAINPLNNRIKKAKFSLPEAIHLLDYLGIEVS